jgi:hypothetical protein
MTGHSDGRSSSEMKVPLSRSRDTGESAESHADRVAPVPLTKDGKRRIVRTGSQTSTVKPTRGELEYLAWYEAKQRAEETPAS